jgi:hypothetical protein
MTNKNLIFLSYGKKSEYLRTISCVLSFFAWNGDKAGYIRIIIYTDDPSFFKIKLDGFNVEYFLLTPETLEALKGDTKFIHRIKVSVIDLTFKNFPNEEVLFIDSDTFFINDAQEMLNEFEPGISFMHKKEYNLRDGFSLFSSFNQGHYAKSFIDYISEREFSIGGIPEIFTADDYSWNSGVIGLQKDFGSYMSDVFKLTDEFYTNSKWFISEQMAFSLILQRRTQIKPAEKFVYHYWGKRQKQLVDTLIEKLFDRYPAAKLPEKMFMRGLTKSWHLIVETDLVLEQAEIAFSQRDFKYGIKKCLQFLLLKIFKVQFKDGRIGFVR